MREGFVKWVSWTHWLIPIFCSWRGNSYFSRWTKAITFFFLKWFLNKQKTNSKEFSLMTMKLFFLCRLWHIFTTHRRLWFHPNKVLIKIFWFGSKLNLSRKTNELLKKDKSLKFDLFDLLYWWNICNAQQYFPKQLNEAPVTHFHIESNMIQLNYTRYCANRRNAAKVISLVKLLQLRIAHPIMIALIAPKKYHYTAKKIVWIDIWIHKNLMEV